MKVCGIYAIFTKANNGFTTGDLNVFSEMGILTQLRGSDSSGVFAVDKDKPKATPKIIKVVGPSPFLYYEKNWDAWQRFALNQAVAIVGHGRSATVGKVTKKNAHPFTANHITLVHNGTIRTGLDKSNEDEVDSAQLCAKIAEVGLDKALDSISGAYAIIVHDGKTGLIHIVRNYERPLNYLENKNGFYILSEKNALSYLYQRSPYIAFGEIKEFAPSIVYTFDPHTKQITERPLERSKYVGYYIPEYSATEEASAFGWRRKEYTPVTAPEKKETSQELVYRDGARITFRLEYKISAKEGERDNTYVGKDEENNTIFFKSSVPHDEYIGKVGVGEHVGATYVAKTGTWLYQVKARSIKWEEDDEDVLVQDGEIIPKSVWKNLCATQTCNVCLERISEEDNEETLVFESGTAYKMVCKNCLKVNMSTLEETEYNRLVQRLMS